MVGDRGLVNSSRPRASIELKPPLPLHLQLQMLYQHLVRHPLFGGAASYAAPVAPLLHLGGGGIIVGMGGIIVGRGVMGASSSWGDHRRDEGDHRLDAQRVGALFLSSYCYSYFLLLLL